MERSGPKLAPEWLKSVGNKAARSCASSLQFTRSKSSSVNNGTGYGLGKPISGDHATLSHSRRSSNRISCDHLRSYSNLGRNGRHYRDRYLNNPSDKITQQRHPFLSSSHVAISNSDALKTYSSFGKLHVLKPSRERNNNNGVSSNCLDPNPHTKNGINPVSATPEPKPSKTVTHKRLSSQAQTRIDFFNLIRNKSCAAAASQVSTAPTTQVQDANEETGKGDGKKQIRNAILCSEEEEAAFLRSLGWDESGDDDEGDLTEEEIATFYTYVSKDIHKLKTALQNFISTTTTANTTCAILCSEEEEVAFLRSLGWEENGDDDDDEGDLTEEEIATFHTYVSKDIHKLKTSLQNFISTTTTANTCATY